MIERASASHRVTGKAAVKGVSARFWRAVRERVNLLDLVGDFHEAIDLIETPEMLSSHLEILCGFAGIRYFAVTHHVSFSRSQAAGIHLHNYPVHFARFHDQQGLGVRDPVHRTSQLRGAGFFWSELPRLIALTTDDYAVLDRAEQAGIGPGYTVPIHVPGEFSGSCSFAMSKGLVFPRNLLAIVQALGAFAFEAARHLQIAPETRRVCQGRLTERERQIVVSIGQGKAEKQIARLLGISPSTVNDHLKHARLRCGVHKSSMLVYCGLLSGSITYSELIDPDYPVFTG